MRESKTKRMCRKDKDRKQEIFPIRDMSVSERVLECGVLVPDVEQKGVP